MDAPATEFWTDVRAITGDFLAKARRLVIDPAVLHPKAHAARHQLQSALAKAFRHQRAMAVATLRDVLKVATDRLKKREDPNAFELASQIFTALMPGFEELTEESEAALAEAAMSGVATGLQQLEITDSDVINAVNQIARDWARERAAEMVGMRRTADGTLVDNPNAEWAITDRTRQDLRDIITEAFEDETPLDALISEIETAGMFSEQRAEMIARTEVSFAQVSGNYQVWQASGQVAGVEWLLSEDHDIEDECDENDGEITEIGEPFPSGDLMPPLHPNCWCAVRAVFADEMEDAEKVFGNGGLLLKGGAGSGNWGHEGRPGEIGGSGPGGGIAHMLVDRIKKDGGFTYSLASHNSPKSGYALSISPENERILNLRSVTTEKMRGILQEYRPVLSSDTRAHIGGWYDGTTKKAYLDVSIVTTSKASAIKLAKQHNQLAIFDLAKGKAIPTGITRAASTESMKLIRYDFHREAAAEDISGFILSLDGTHKVTKATGASDCDWVTINGAHVCIGEGGTIERGPKEFVGSHVRNLRAKLSYVPATKEMQDKGDAWQEKIAKTIGGKVSRDNAPADVLIGNKHAVEVKTIQTAKDDKVPMRPDSRHRKEAYVQTTGMTGHTVAVDLRGAKAQIYYKEGFGAFRFHSMEKVTLGQLQAKFQ
jgi:SPP1 gp7 family putative phage head morphogenesis protein